MQTDHQQADWINSFALHTGSKLGNDPKFAQNTHQVVTDLVHAGYNNMFYGGGSAGTMGLGAKAAIEAGAAVTGISFEFFLKAQGADLPGAKASITARDMKHRIDHMYSNSQANLGNTGSVGTTEEIFDWDTQRSDIIKPQILNNLDGYWEGLYDYFVRCVHDGKEHPSFLKKIFLADTPSDIVDRFNEFNSRAAIIDPLANASINNDADYVTESQHAVRVGPNVPVDVLGRIFTRVVEYDIANVPGQHIFTGDIIKPIVFNNESGALDGIKHQLQTIFDAGFAPAERSAFFHFAKTAREARDIVGDLDASDPLRPADLQKKHAESEHVDASSIRLPTP